MATTKPADIAVAGGLAGEILAGGLKADSGSPLDNRTHTRTSNRAFGHSCRNVLCAHTFTISVFDMVAGKFRARGESLREDLHSTAALMPPEQDWFFGAELRLEGQVQERIDSAETFSVSIRISSRILQPASSFPFIPIVTLE